ncbi:MAG: ATP-binding protein [Thermoanaerobaculia bacterium]
MLGLTAAHRGYEYQDLLVACRLVDVLLGTLVQVHVDEKLIPGDRFDDLTTVDISGHRERIQFKHTDNDDKPLTLATFTSDDRGLRLDRLIAAILTDRLGPGSHSKHHSFRVILRDKPPLDPRLTAVLAPTAVDPGPFIPAMPTIRLAFDAEALWKHVEQKSNIDSPPGEGYFGFLSNEEMPMLRADLEWACQHLIIEVAAPAASGDLTTPEIAERLLLMRVRTDVGAEAYPNVNRSAIDVAAAMIGAARAARQRRLIISSDELLRWAQLRHDFGAVSRAHPVDRSVEVLRTITVRKLAESTAELANIGGRLLVVGPPGQGKSWVCQQLLDELSSRGWLTSEHYCYLGDADGERLARVLAETVFGSLLGRLADADPRLVVDHRPRFAADEEALIGCLTRSLQYDPQRPVALLVDGIDHITRIRSRGGNFDPSLNLAEALSALALPKGSVLIVLSQPGVHLKPLEEAGATTLTIPGLDEIEIRSLAARLRVVPPIGMASYNGDRPLLETDEAVSEFLSALADRSAGNALYATYLCREALRQDSTPADPATIVRSFPPFDGTLESYYQYLHSTLGAESGWVADVIALIDFAVNRSELLEIRPDASHHIDKALEVLAPVLVERAAQGGVRIYHESFARFLRRPFQNDPIALGALLNLIAAWLERKGFFSDPRAFSSLLPTLTEAGRDAEVVTLIERGFVVRAVAAGFSASSINNNLATAIGSAARIKNWPAVARYVELSRAADAYQDERFDSSLVQFADIPMALLGPGVVSDRLLHNDRLVMPARSGLQMCAAVDELGAVAPWSQYMRGYLREAKADNTSYGAESDRKVALAWLRGRLRLSVLLESSEHQANLGSHDDDNDGEPNDREWNPASPLDWNRLVHWVNRRRLPAFDVVKAIYDTYGLPSVIKFIRMLDRPGDMYLALAELTMVNGAVDSTINARQWAINAASCGVVPGSAYRMLALGVDLSNLAILSVSDARDRLLSLTQDLQHRSAQWEGSSIGEWLDACAVAARRDLLGLNSAEALICGEGWYRCWLRFCVALVRAESAHVADQSVLALDALRCLTEDLNPFSGEPRSCDLYSIHGRIEDTIRRAMGLLNDSGWSEALLLLRGVSRSITTTIQGELGGPLPPSLLLRIALDGATPTRREVATDFVAEEIENGSARRYYSDLAEYRLLGSRLALASGERVEATRLWHEACEMLTAYGWHKDITIYELLDPLPALIAADPARSRNCVARVQPVCERVPIHTDGKGTRQVWERWWELLAKADPVALAHLAASRLLCECNDPNWLLHGALVDLWREWQERTDPIIAGALRLTLDIALDPRDPLALARLTDRINRGDSSCNELMALLLARADERPVEYSYSNSSELLAKDDARMAEFNLVAQQANLPQAMPVREFRDGASPSRSLRGAVRRSLSKAAFVFTDITACFPAGAVGLAYATRAWRSRPYDAPEANWSVDRFANIIGYRMIELINTGREGDMVASLLSLAEATRFYDQFGILRAVAEGLERHRQHRLAAMAYTLAWTRARNHGGWLRFGGETEIDSLHRATQLDHGLVLSVVADEVQRTVAGGYGTYGISQALIYGFGVGALSSCGTSSLDTAFGVWDEIFSVIASRAPRVHPSDDPDDTYTPPDPDDGTAAPGDLDAALALSTLAGLAHPAREKKRRTLLAVQLLLSERPTQSALAVDLALANLSDPATLTWLLRVVEQSGEPREIVVAKCQETLTRLATGPYLTIRALARRLLRGAEPPLPPPTPADRALVEDCSVDLWTPHGNNYEPLQPPGRNEEFLDLVAGLRLEEAESLLPGLRKGVLTRLSTAIHDETRQKRLRAQLDAFADRLGQQWPNAYLIPEQTVEEMLQLVATGGRAARIVKGNPSTDPVRWEDTLASKLLDDPMLPIRVEGCRQPRPLIPPPPALRDPIWSDVASEREQVLAATLTVESFDTAAIMAGGRFHGWRVIATVETRMVKHPDPNIRKELVAKRYRALEVRKPGDRRGLTLPPFAGGDIRWWSTSVEDFSNSKPHTLSGSHPVIGLDNDVEAAGDGLQSLGIPIPLLCPTIWLMATLGLRPGEPFILDAEDGPGLSLVIWRTDYDTSEYYLTRPRIWGAAIFMRQAMLDRLVDAVGSALSIRDFIVGDLDLSSPARET